MYHIIINPNAGRGQTLAHLPYLTRLFAENKFLYTTYITMGPLDAQEKAREICEKHGNCKGIIGIGGDGTFQEIVAGAYQARSDIPRSENYKIPVPLAIFPAGSGNDLILTIEGGKQAALSKYGKNAEQNARAFFDTLIHGETRAVDVIVANSTAFLNIGNLGLDARIVKTAAALKKSFGSKAYYAAVYQSIVGHKNLPLVIEADGKKFEGEYTLVAICNGRYYGGGMPIAPSARPDDGKITLCVVDGISRAKIMVLFPLLAVEKHERLKCVNFIECESVKINLQDSAETLCLDGNLYPDIGNEIVFKLLPKALDVFI